MELSKADILQVKLQRSEKSPRGCDKEHWKKKQQHKYKLVENLSKRSLRRNKEYYSCVFSKNKIIYLDDFPSGSHNVMAMREKQTQFREKYMMLVNTDGKGNLGL